MPWKPMDEKALKMEFVLLALRREVPFAELCRRYGISRTNGYKVLGRYRSSGEAGLAGRPRRPKRSPLRLSGEVEEKVVRLRRENPRWGARKLRRLLLDAGVRPAPAVSTVGAVLRRRGLVDAERSAASRPYIRFEWGVPNALWQMDFKGSIATLGGRCHTLTVLDDCTRFNIVLAALPDERADGVMRELEKAFRRYGLPDAMLMDNGAPWGSDRDHQHTVLTTWLMRLGIRVIHSRPYHPQTAGKDERFHRTLGEELLDTVQWRDCGHCQQEFDRWRTVYNTVRPHEALGMDTPASRYRPSLRAWPGELPPVTYPEGAAVRRVDQNGRVSFRNRSYRVGKAFRGEPVRLIEGARPGAFDVYFLRTKVAHLDTGQECVTDVPGTL